MSLHPVVQAERRLGYQAPRRATTAPEEAAPSDSVPPRLLLLGGFLLWHDGVPVPVPPTGQRLVALLALSDWPLPRAHLAGRLWLDAPEERAAASLRSALWRLPQPGGEPLVEATATHVALHGRVDVDYRELIAVAAALERPGHNPAEVAAATLMEDLLPGWYEDWVLVERERFRQLRLHALESLSARLIQAGRFGAAIQAALGAVAGEPLRESAHRQLIQAHIAEGNPAEAVRQYRLCRRLLADELGVEPSPAIRTLVKGLLREASPGAA